MSPAAAPFVPEALAISAADSDADVDNVARVRERKKAAKKRRQITLGVSAAGLAALAIAMYVGFAGGHSTRHAKKKGAGHVAKVQADEEDDDVEGAAGDEKNARVEPIALTLVPEGARIIIHLRPADLWQSGGTAEEFRACLGPVGVWLENYSQIA